jgi:electron-transferring-flavoprotein dehydrogenase
MTAATELLLGEGGEVQGIVTGDLGRARDGSEKPGFAAGIGLRARYTLIGEGARGSLAKQLSARFGLVRDADPQHYGLGIKEIWQVAPERHQPGRVDHYLGFPFDNQTSGGGFVYHADGGQVYLGLVTHLDYSDPTLSPFDEFQRFKTHPAVASLLAGATRVSYGARAVTSGGLQSIPTLAFPGGALIGCAAGFMNFPALKAIHSAFRSGRAAGEQVVEAIAAGRAHDVMTGLDRAVRATGIEAELVAVQNVKPLLARFGTVAGMLLAGADLWSRALFRASPFGALRNRQTDSAALRKVTKTRIYDKPDGRLTFDRASSVFLANLSHDEDQPVHLRLADARQTATETIPRYGAEPAPNYCPAGVYQLVEGAEGPELRINAANCVHCKTCDIKDPAGNITWVPPEGGSGPNYSGM